MTTADRWPELDYAGWSDTLATLHMWTQVIGKVRAACAPWINHSWHVTLYVTPVGLTTSTMYHDGTPFDIELDLQEHELTVRLDDGTRRTMRLEPMTVASFYGDVLGLLHDLDLPVRIHPVPSEVADPIPFPDDTVHRSYDPAAAGRVAEALNHTARVFTSFRARFLGKCSPVHFFWGSFDLAVTRFSGRRAPPHAGGIPGLPDWVTREAYSHEVYSSGFWPGGPASPAAAFYAYAYPVPEGLGEARIVPSDAFWSAEMGEFFLPYDAVRTAANPDAKLTAFLESTYEAVANLAQWNRAELEVPPRFPRSLNPSEA